MFSESIGFITHIYLRINPLIQKVWKRKLLWVKIWPSLFRLHQTGPLVSQPKVILCNSGQVQSLWWMTTIVMILKSLYCVIPSFHLLQCLFIPKTLQSPCGINAPGATPYAAPLWHGSEINKQKKIHIIPFSEIKTVHIVFLGPVVVLVIWWYAVCCSFKHVIGQSQQAVKGQCLFHQRKSLVAVVTSFSAKTLSNFDRNLLYANPFGSS